LGAISVMTEPLTKSGTSSLNVFIYHDQQSCPLFETCKSPSKRKGKWACALPMQERLRMCAEFYILCVLMNNGRSPYDRQ
jgi:hypothetical protein